MLQTTTKIIFMDRKIDLRLKLQVFKEKCERLQLRSMDWWGERPFGHQTAHLLLINSILTFANLKQ